MAAPIAVAPAEGAIPGHTYTALVQNALVDGGIVGIDEEIEQTYFNRAAIQLNWLLAQWARKRWLTYRIQDYAVVTTGALTYGVGLNGDINISPRPDRLEYAYLRFLNNPNPQNLAVDIPLDIIQSEEDYSRITVKTIGTLPWRVRYDPAWPMGILKPWPVPQASLYEIHCGFKAVLPRFSDPRQPINFPPEYEAALNWCLARRLRASYQMPEDETVNSLARDALNTIRLANQQMPTLRMPNFLRNRQRGYDYRGDTDEF